MKSITKIVAIVFMPFILMAGEHSVEQLFSVQTVQVKQERVAHSKKHFGFVKRDDARVYHVAPRFGGYVEKIYADKIYKYVKKGEALVSVYSPEVYKAKEDYLNSYNYAKSRENSGMLESAKLKLQLLGVSDSEIDEVISTQKVSQLTTIYAPISGYIFKKNITAGSAFSAKKELYEIVNLDEVWIEAKIFEDDIAWLKKVKDFDMYFQSRSTPYRATAQLLYPNVDPKEATFTLRLQLKNDKGEIFPGMYATIISKDTSQSYVTLPSSAVLRKDGKFYVFIVGEFEGEYEPIEVQAKPLNAETYIISEGVNAGDEVVSNALFMMDSDAQINGLY